MKILAIDPGKDSGWALFEDGLLVGCGLLQVTSTDATQYKALADRLLVLDVCIVERPAIYPGRKQKASTTNIITLALTAGGAMAHCGRRARKKIYVEPRKWKGQRPKDVDNRRTISLLSAAEKKIVGQSGVGETKLNNVLDAVGIGLWYLERKNNAQPEKRRPENESNLPPADQTTNH